MSESPEEQKAKIAAAADDSQFGYKEWEESVALVDAWLADHKRVLTIDEILQYIDCCAASIAAASRYESLVDTTAEMLKAHGCTKAREND